MLGIPAAGPGGRADARSNLMRYVLPGIQLESECPLDDFRAFISEAPSDLPLCTLRFRREPFPDRGDAQSISHANLLITELADGWLYRLAGVRDCALHVSRDYARFTAYLTAATPRTELLMPLIRTALECASIGQGVLSLHSACVTLDGQALCLTAASGTGKSTRALCWQTGLQARILSGDRPALRLHGGKVWACGVPWDGKEQLYINACVPLLAICHIRRGVQTYLRRLSPCQARRVLTQQCFIPMWDLDTAAAAMLLIRRLCHAVPLYRATCGPDESAAKEVWDLVFRHPESIMEMEHAMKLKQGFALRNIAGEHIVMPTGENIRKFDGAIVLNPVAAFIWETLAEGCSREELLQAILAEYEIDRAQAEQDLDSLLETLRGYQVLEEDPV